MRISYEQMAQMRKEGVTLSEIGKTLGVSKQRVFQMLLAYDNSLKGVRGRGFCVNTIVFKGIYEHFENNIRESISTFTQKVYGHLSNNNTHTMKTFITGKSDSKFTIKQIKNMCEATGKTFEELFVLREGDEM